MGHANARLNLHGRRLLVSRVRDHGRPVAHVAKELGVSRQCAHRWVARYDAEGDAGLQDRSSRPASSPTRTAVKIEQKVLAHRRKHRRGRDWISAETGVSPRTVSRILARHGVAHLVACDPMTGERIRSSKATDLRYERGACGELIHADVKKIGRIHNGGGHRAHGRTRGQTGAQKRARIGYDFVHSAIDDHSRLAYSEILADEKALTVVGFLSRALEFFAEHGIHVRQLMTDNAWSYKHSHDLAELLTEAGVEHIFIKPHCPWQNGKVERFNRTLQTEWAYSQVFTSNHARTRAFTTWLNFYNTQRRHTALEGKPPISRVPVSAT